MTLEAVHSVTVVAVCEACCLPRVCLLDGILLHEQLQEMVGLRRLWRRASWALQGRQAPRDIDAQLLLSPTSLIPNDTFCLVAALNRRIAIGPKVALYISAQVVLVNNRWIVRL